MHNLIYTMPNYSNVGGLYPHPTNPLVFYTLGGRSNGGTVTEFYHFEIISSVSEGKIIYSCSLKENISTSVIRYGYGYRFSSNGKYILKGTSTSMSTSGQEIGIILLNENGDYVDVYKLGTTETIKYGSSSKYYACDVTMLNNSNKGIVVYDKKIKFFSITISEETGEISSEIIKEVNLNIKNEDEIKNVEDNTNVFFGEVRVTSDNSRLLILAGTYNGSRIPKNPKVAVFDISNILQLEDGATIDSIQLYNPRIGSSETSYSIETNLFLSKDSTIVRLFKYVPETKSDGTYEYPMKSAIATANGRRLMGVKYKGEYFYK